MAPSSGKAPELPGTQGRDGGKQALTGSGLPGESMDSRDSGEGALVTPAQPWEAQMSRPWFWVFRQGLRPG